MSLHVCRSCRRLNPPLAAYCYFDGTPLSNGTHGPRAFGSEEFPTPFVLPCGRACRSFEELARTCRDNWAEARGLLKNGGYRSFLLQLGRCDLVQTAERAAKHPDLDLGLDDFLAQLPGRQPAAPRLEIRTPALDLGTIPRGQDRHFLLTIQNSGERLLSGLVRSADCVWLGVYSAHLNEKRLQASGGELVQIPIYVRGHQLRAGPQRQVGELAVESNGGTRSIQVFVQVPVTPFPDGVFQGAKSPRQLADKARTAPQELARLIEDGSVARWYQCNGWKYPFRRPAVNGLSAVQQYLKALGLPMPPGVEAELRKSRGAGLPPLPTDSAPAKQDLLFRPTKIVPVAPPPQDGLPPLPEPAFQGAGSDVVLLAEARIDSAGAQTRRTLSCLCLLLSFVLLISAAALAAWKLLNIDRGNTPPPSGKQSTAAVAPQQ